MAAKKKKVKTLVDAATEAAIEVGIAAEHLQESFGHMARAKSKARPVTTAARRAGRKVAGAAKKAGRTVAGAAKRAGRTVARTAKKAVPGTRKRRTTAKRSRSSR